MAARPLGGQPGRDQRGHSCSQDTEGPPAPWPGPPSVCPLSGRGNEETPMVVPRGVRARCAGLSICHPRSALPRGGLQTFRLWYSLSWYFGDLLSPVAQNSLLHQSTSWGSSSSWPGRGAAGLPLPRLMSPPACLQLLLDPQG